MKVFVTFLVLAFVGSSFANRAICPHPDETGDEVAAERITLDKPLAGHAAVEIDFSSKVLGRALSCFSLVTESQNSGPHIVAIGRNHRGGASAKIYTEEKTGLIATLEAYIPKKKATLFKSLKV